MSAAHALAILDTMPDLFAQMGAGSALGVQIKEIARRLHRVRAAVPWTGDQAHAGAKIRARAASYALRYRPDADAPALRAANEVRLDEVRAAFLELRSYLVLEAAREAAAEPPAR